MKLFDQLGATNSTDVKQSWRELFFQHHSFTHIHIIIIITTIIFIIISELNAAHLLHRSRSFLTPKNKDVMNKRFLNSNQPPSTRASDRLQGSSSLLIVIHRES